MIVIFLGNDEMVLGAVTEFGSPSEIASLVRAQEKKAPLRRLKTKKHKLSSALRCCVTQAEAICSSGRDGQSRQGFHREKEASKRELRSDGDTGRLERVQRPQGSGVVSSGEAKAGSAKGYQASGKGFHEWC